ncbi:MAG: DUF58 domain-containing protein [Planctomycetota bacterium]|nr:MAG: DUF58 domain-containing protein [Planctomycetota bacterium]
MPRESSIPSAPADATMYLHPQTLARLGSLELRAKHIVEGVMSGMHRSPHHGFSVEFAEHRQYVPGDDIRHLDWKVFGRTDKLHLKQYQQETNLDLMLLVDASGSMDFGSRMFSDASGVGAKESADGRPYWSKFDHATALAAAMAYISIKQGDRVGLIVYADSIKAMVKPSGAQAQWRQIVGALSTQPVRAPTDIARVVDQTLGKINNRRLLVFISDFFEDPGQIRAALARCKHRRQDVILFQTIDRREREFDVTESAPFEGLEGEGRLRVDPRALRAAYLEAFNGHVEAVHRIARSFGFDHEVVSTHDWLGPPLAAFLARRNARLKRSKAG